MKIVTIPVGQLQTNCYLLIDEKNGVCAVIDPGDEGEAIAAEIARRGCTPQVVLLTHGHFDHWQGLDALLAQFPALEVYIHQADAVSGRGGDLHFPRLDDKHQRYYREGDTVTVGDIRLNVWDTPGHSTGSVCLLGDGVIFSGDTLFRGNCGRCDFPGGDYRAMLRSLARLGRLEGQYAIYPGHDRDSDLDFERAHNPYMRQGMAQ